jgi:hypothetical protein
VIAAEQYDGDARHGLRDALGGFDAGAIRHVHVEQHDVGHDVLRALDGLAAGGHFGNDCMTELAQEIDEQRTRVVVIFRDEHSDA